MNIVIIAHNEQESIMRMASVLTKQGLLNSAVWVLDRCTDKSEDICKEIGVEYIVNTKGEGRQTSTCRNMGYRWCSDKIFKENTLFLDADRWPVLGDLNSLESSPTDITLLKLQKDLRDDCAVDYNKIYGTVYNNFFSCGIFIKEDACKKLIQFYSERKDDYGNSLIFPETVQQFWGIEDTHLGDICYHLGLTCDFNNEIRLQGTFAKLSVDSLDTIEQRFKLRDKLNVLW